MAQHNLLAAHWDLLKRPAMVPVLMRLYANPPKNMGFWMSEAVVRRLSEVAPADARRLMVAEIRQPTGRLSRAFLATLPDRSLPELDDEFATRMEAGQLVDDLILRYATGTIAERLKRAYLRHPAQSAGCRWPLVLYFLRHDPAFGESEARRILATPGGDARRCLDVGFHFHELGQYAASPALERIAIEYLSSPVVAVKHGFAVYLREYGSAAAKAPLWQTLEYFRSWWKGREMELEGPGGREGAEFEIALVTALTHAKAWTLDDAELRRLLALCSGIACRESFPSRLRP